MNPGDKFYLIENLDIYAVIIDEKNMNNISKKVSNISYWNNWCILSLDEQDDLKSVEKLTQQLDFKTPNDIFMKVNYSFLLTEF